MCQACPDVGACVDRSLHVLVYSTVSYCYSLPEVCTSCTVSACVAVWSSSKKTVTLIIVNKFYNIRELNISLLNTDTPHNTE